MSRLSLAKQRLRQRSVRLELLDEKQAVIGEISGAVNSCNINISATSDIRRTATVNMIVKDKNFEFGANSYIWFNRYIRLWMGEQSFRDGYQEFNMGVFVIDAPSYTYDVASNELTVSLLDLACTMNGQRGGKMPNNGALKIYAGESVRSLLIFILSVCGYNEYDIDIPATELFPNDVELGNGSSYWDVVNKVIEYFPGYQAYFNVDGMFCFKELPDDDRDTPPIYDDELWDSVVISEDYTIDMSAVRNHIKVQGRTHEPRYFDPTATVENGVIKVNVDLTNITVSGIYEVGFALANVELNAPMKIKIGNFEVKNMLDYGSDEPWTRGLHVSVNEEFFCVYVDITASWDDPHQPPDVTLNTVHWMGHLIAEGECYNLNEQSPYKIIWNNEENRPCTPAEDRETIGEIYEFMEQGELPTDYYCEEWAKREVWLASDCNDTISINAVPVPWLDANDCVEYTLRRNRHETYKFLIQEVRLGFGVSETMTVTLQRLYAPQIIN